MRAELRAGESVAPDTDAPGVRHGTDGVAGLALGGRPLAPTPLPRGAFAPRPNRIQGRVRRPARVRRRGVVVQPRRPGAGQRPPGSPRRRTHLHVPRLLRPGARTPADPHQFE